MISNMNDTGKLNHLRHSLAHLLAAAILELYPDAKNTIGPAIDNGFYYDFDFAVPFKETDLKKVEQKMREILKTWKGFDCKEVSEKEAKEHFKENSYKLELISELGDAIPKQKITFYTSGQFTDLCRGGHVEDMAEMKKAGWRLSHIAGAYWRGMKKKRCSREFTALLLNQKKPLMPTKRDKKKQKNATIKNLVVSLSSSPSPRLLVQDFPSCSQRV